MPTSKFLHERQWQQENEATCWRANNTAPVRICPLKRFASPNGWCSTFPDSSDSPSPYAPMMPDNATIALYTAPPPLLSAG